ncbi:MAG: hypothetical protein IJ830_04415 [Alphaproteobacteria bacterium]|nr:hypothetical protein [Alphaproteobacteria bacterium]
MRNNETGRSMVEMLGVLAIIGVLSAGGLAGYSKAMFKHKLNSTMEQISIMVTGVRTAYGQKGNYDELSLTNAQKVGAIPATVTANPFKGTIELAQASAKSGAADTTAFTLKYTGIPNEACVALATADFGSGAGSGFIGVDVGNSSTVNVGDVRVVDNGSATTRGEGYPYLMSDAIAACKATNDNATIIWKFY